MIIDISPWLKADKKPPKEESATLRSPQDQPTPPPKALLQQQKFDACLHKSMSIDDKQRTVKCGDCGMWLDPVWCLRELFRYYEQRVDIRLQQIKAFEERQQEKAERREKRKTQPRAAKAATMRENLERAAFNEYQAKLLDARAQAQRLAAEKIQAELESA